MEITKDKFTEVMLSHFTGVGNEWDEEEDLEGFNEILENVWKDLGEEVKPSTEGGYYEVVWADLSGNEPERHIFHTREDLISNLEGDWTGGVILAIFDPKGNGILEELEEHIHDENH